MTRLPHLRPILTALLAGVVFSAPGRAALSDYTNRVEQIADESYINRDPVVSRAGLVAWYGYKGLARTAEAARCSSARPARPGPFLTGPYSPTPPTCARRSGRTR
ncbi:MAG: hypothetical protein U1G05_05170 [Kiritimatiellia bacterium]